MRGAEGWRARAATLEAMALLAVARWLIAGVAFAQWRKSLGMPVMGVSSDSSLRLDANLPARRLARAVERAAGRLPGECRCLPRAMALQWMLQRRGMVADLAIGVRPGDARGGLDDLHAWVVREGEVLVGASDTPHHAIYVARGRAAAVVTTRQGGEP